MKPRIVPPPEAGSAVRAAPNGGEAFIDIAGLKVVYARRGGDTLLALDGIDLKVRQG
jgi:hypothetical protein